MVMFYGLIIVVLVNGIFFNKILVKVVIFGIRSIKYIDKNYIFFVYIWIF